jgi:hypothetical protein
MAKPRFMSRRGHFSASTTTERPSVTDLRHFNRTADPFFRHLMARFLARFFCQRKSPTVVSDCGA